MAGMLTSLRACTRHFRPTKDAVLQYSTPTICVRGNIIRLAFFCSRVTGRIVHHEVDNQPVTTNLVGSTGVTGSSADGDCTAVALFAAYLCN